MAKVIAPAMKAWLKFGHPCRQALGIKPFKKASPKQKSELKACVVKKARAIGISMNGSKKK